AWRWLCVGEKPRPAVGVWNDGDLKVGACRCLGLDEVADVGDVPKHSRGYPAPDVPCHYRLPEPDAEELRRIDAAVDARHYVQAQAREERDWHIEARVGARERFVA